MVDLKLNKKACEDIVYIELFRRVGSNYHRWYRYNPRWTRVFSWTKEEKNSFRKWLTQLFSRNKDIMKAISSFDVKNKADLEFVVEEFLVRNSWRVAWK